jgi:Mg-chelatase subunit ChlD
MQGIFGWVRDNLEKSIEALQPDEYFCVIVFGGDKILESGNGRLVRATEQAKKEAYGFIASICPAGTTNTLPAMERAVKVRDTSGVGPGLIYFLTDGFELGDQDASRFGDRISVMLRSFAPKTKVNTIGFWPEEQDRRLLEAIARESGGEFILITDVDEQTNADNRLLTIEK